MDFKEIQKNTENSVYLRGMDIFWSKKIYDFEVKRENYNKSLTSIEIDAKVEASNASQKYRVHINILGSSIEFIYCKCQYFLSNMGSNPKKCKHIVAVLLHYLENSSKYEKNEVTKKDSEFKSIEKLIHHYKNQSNSFNVKEKYELRFIFGIEDHNIRIYLKLFNFENSKVYKVKNVFDLIEAFFENKLFSFTPNFQIDFSNAEFVFENNHSLFWDYLSEMYHSSTSNWDLKYFIFEKNFAFISSIDFLKILKKMKGNEINIAFERDRYSSSIPESDMYLLSADEFKLDIKTEYSKNNILTLKVDEVPGIINQNCPIIIFEDMLYILDEKEFETLSLFVVSFLDSNNVLKLNKEMTDDFVNYVLPQLKNITNYSQIVEKMKIELIEEKLDIILNFDYSENRIICEPIFKYGEYEFDIKQNLISNDAPTSTLLKDLSGEEKFKNWIATIGFGLVENKLILNYNENKFIKFLSKDILELSEQYKVFYSTNFEQIRHIKKPSIEVKLESLENSNLLDFSFEMKDISKEEMVEIFTKANQQNKYHRLKTGKFISLEDSTILEFQKMLETFEFDLTKQDNLKISNANALFLSKQLDNKNIIWDNKDYFKKILKNIEQANIDYEISKNFKSDLREYQTFGFKWLKTLSKAKFGGILADEMGLGKTAQTLSFIQSEFDNDKNLNPVIVVCPASLIYNWSSEITKFTPNLSVNIITGNPAQRKELLKKYKDFNINLISYPLLKTMLEELKDKTFSYSFIDEAQYIKNHDSLVSKSVKAINAPIRFALTGTPIENNLLELWSIFDYCMPHYLLSHTKFKKIFSDPITKEDNQKLDILRKKISPFILRRLKQDVLKDLPEKNIINILVDLDDEQKKLYSTYAKAAKAELNEEFRQKGVNKSQIQFLAVIMKLRQICSDPNVIMNNYNGGNAKYDIVKNIFEENIEKNKILLFSQFTKVLKNLHNSLNTENNMLYMDGQVNTKDRPEIINDFIENDDYRVFMLSLKTGGVGLNLTNANIVIHYDPWWNPAVENQATDRAHRIGQEKNVEVYKLIAKGTIEEKILKLHDKKLKLSKDLLDGDDYDKLLTQLSEDEIYELLDFEF